MAVGPKTKPIPSDEPMKVAREVFNEKYVHTGRMPGLVYAADEFWEWRETRWVPVPTHEMEDKVWLELEDAWVGSGDAMKRLAPSQRGIEEIVRAMGAITKLDAEGLPIWLGGPPDGPDPRFCVGFEDVVVDIRASARAGQVVTYPRDQRWFDMVALPGKWEGDANRPVYEEKLKEWMEGDSVRETLLLRTMGYFLIPWKGYPFWWMLYGPPQSGKSTHMWLAKEILGHPAFFGTDLDALCSNFGLEGVHSARLVCINEVYELEGRKGDRGSSLIKSILGGDEVSVDRKHIRVKREKINAAVVMVSNEIPRLPNKGRGMSSKMVPIVFKRSWEGRQDTGLKDVLRGELNGIAKLYLQAAIELEAAPDLGSKFVLDEHGKEAIHRYQVLNNPLDEFLDWGFTKNPRGFVRKKLVCDLFEQFEVENRMRLGISRTQLPWKLINETTWDLSESRPHGDERVLRGLSVRPRREAIIVDDEPDDLEDVDG